MCFGVSVPRKKLENYHKNIDEKFGGSDDNGLLSIVSKNSILKRDC